MRQTREKIQEIADRAEVARQEAASRASYEGAMFDSLFMRPFTELTPEEQKDAWDSGEIPSLGESNLCDPCPKNGGA